MVNSLFAISNDTRIAPLQILAAQPSGDQIGPRILLVRRIDLIGMLRSHHHSSMDWAKTLAATFSQGLFQAEVSL